MRGSRRTPFVAEPCELVPASLLLPREPPDTTIGREQLDAPVAGRGVQPLEQHLGQSCHVRRKGRPIPLAFHCTKYACAIRTLPLVQHALHRSRPCYRLPRFGNNHVAGRQARPICGERDSKETPLDPEHEELVAHLLEALQTTGAPQGVWLVDIARVRSALREADTLLLKMQNAILGELPPLGE